MGKKRETGVEEGTMGKMEGEMGRGRGDKGERSC